MFHHKERREEDYSGEDYSRSAEYGEDDYKNKKSEYSEDYESQENPSRYGRNSNQGNYGATESYTEEYTQTNEDRVENYKKEEAGHKKFERFAEAEALAAGGYALYERHEMKKDPEHAGRHKLEEEIAGAAAAGGAGFGIYEHHERKATEREEEELEGKKKHGWFG